MQWYPSEKCRPIVNPFSFLSVSGERILHFVHLVCVESNIRRVGDSFLFNRNYGVMWRSLVDGVTYCIWWQCYHCSMSVGLPHGNQTFHIYKVRSASCHFHFLYMYTKTLTPHFMFFTCTSFAALHCAKRSEMNLVKKSSCWSIRYITNVYMFTDITSFTRNVSKKYACKE